MKPKNYLIKDYDCISDEKWLKTKDDIESYFKDIIYDLLECGQGFYQDEGNFFVMIQNGKFYNVNVKVEIGGTKQDRGDKLYFIEGVKDISITEVEQPKEKDRLSVNYTLKLTDEEKKEVDKFLSKFN